MMLLFFELVSEISATAFVFYSFHIWFYLLLDCDSFHTVLFYVTSMNASYVNFFLPFIVDQFKLLIDLFLVIFKICASVIYLLLI